MIAMSALGYFRTRPPGRSFFLRSWMQGAFLRREPLERSAVEVAPGSSGSWKQITQYAGMLRRPVWSKSRSQSCSPQHDPKIGLALLAALVPFVFSPACADEDAIHSIVLSNAEHTLWHEAGHALISEFQLPVIGQEEDAVDHFATLSMLAEEDAARLERLLDVAELWLISHEVAQAEGEEPIYYGEHDLDAQRGLQVLCFVAGEGPGRAHELTAEWGLPEERAETCEYDYGLALDGWDTLLESVARPEDARPARVKVSYGDSDSPWREVLQKAELLEYVAAYMAASFDFEDGMRFEAVDCDEANAFWDPEARTVTLCYELLEDFEDLARIAVEG
ncbi:MAG: DUF4344 domain-containing metallopeptidase [Pseudomonadota bacterium]